MRGFSSSVDTWRIGSGNLSERDPEAALKSGLRGRGRGGRTCRPRRDTLVVPSLASQSAKPGPAAVRPDLELPDPLGFSLTTFVGGGGLGKLPELGIVDSLGRRTGFDPATGRSMEQIPRSGYYSDPDIDDDSAPGRDSMTYRDTTPVERPIASRELTVSAHEGERYVLEIAASDSGTYYVDVRLHANRGYASDLRPMHEFPLRAGQVRRFAIRVGAGTMELTEVP